MKDKWYKLLYYGTIGIQLKLRIYTKLLKSDKYFTREDYKHFGNRIYELRLLRKEIAEELGDEILNYINKSKQKIKEIEKE